MSGPAESQNKNKFCEFYGDKGHSTDECIHLRKQIEEAVKSGQLSHLIKELKLGGSKGEHAKTAKKRETSNKEKATTIFMVQPWQRITRQRVTQSFSASQEISFSPLANNDRQENPIMIEAEVEGHLTHCILRPEVKSQMTPASTPLLGFSGKISWSLGHISLMVSLGYGEHSMNALMKFMVVRSPSSYNEGGIVTLRSNTIMPVECRMVEKATNEPPPDKPVMAEGIKNNLDIFAWKPTDMTEHLLNIREGCPTIRQKRRGQAPDQNKAIQEEVSKLVESQIMREVHYHNWLSNLVMVKKHDGSWRMCVDFTYLNKSCPKDCYPLPKIDWKVESLYGYPYKCFLEGVSSNTDSRGR
ncbi:hypothetical protein Tco_1009708 [Tanacetum coccineum]